MYSLEKMKELAVKQMRAAADLYEVCEKAERGMVEHNETYNKTYLRAQRDFRYRLLGLQFDLTATTEEKELWDEIMEELD